MSGHLEDKTGGYLDVCMSKLMLPIIVRSDTTQRKYSSVVHTHFICVCVHVCFSLPEIATATHTHTHTQISETITAAYVSPSV